ncbi:MAG TPA: sigma-70 family RNA polymerase sigma factor [Steroidobacteraceae bacterium]|nr:sigma-70 family RNA polymerase sigma factor [Steroidobacteraceae bacterium]
MNAATVITDASRQQFAALLEQHRRMVFKVANTYARATDREDLAQEIAAQLWRAYPDYDVRRPFSTWLYRIALNVGISHLRSQAARERRTVPLELDLHEAAHPPASEPEADEAPRMLGEFIAQLDPLNRALLLLYLDERSYREIAEILGISETNVSTKINRLKERVRRFGETHGTR